MSLVEADVVVADVVQAAVVQPHVVEVFDTGRRDSIADRCRVESPIACLSSRTIRFIEKY